jgi:hypothetical protein
MSPPFSSLKIIKLSASADNPEDELLLVYNVQLSNRITVLDLGHVSIGGDESCDLHFVEMIPES